MTKIILTIFFDTKLQRKTSSLLCNELSSSYNTYRNNEIGICILQQVYTDKILYSPRFKSYSSGFQKPLPNFYTACTENGIFHESNT